MIEKRKDPLNLDANESAFFQRELEYIKTKTYDTKYKQLRALMLFPVETDADAGAEFITYRSYSKVGTAKIISDYANDFPRSDVYGKEVQLPLRGIGNSYGYSIEEIRRSQMAGKSLDQRRANSTRRASDQKVDDIAWSGDSEYGLLGFIDYPGISQYTVPADGSGSSKTWSSKTPDQIVRDVTGMVNAVIDTTNGIEVPDTLFLPIAQYNDIASRRMTDGNDKTVLTYIMENNPYIKRIEWAVELKGAGAGSSDRMMVFMNDINNLAIQLPVPFEQFPPQAKGMEFVIHCHQKTGGMVIYYPQSVAYGDGI